MKRQSTADVLYDFVTYRGQQALLMWDLDLGDRSLTNDIDNVVFDVEQIHRLSLIDHLIFYKDSEGDLTGWDPHLKDYYSISKDDSDLTDLFNISFKTAKHL